MDILHILSTVVMASLMIVMIFNMVKSPLKEIENLDTIALKTKMLMPNTVLEVSLSSDQDLKETYGEVIELFSKNRPELAVSYITRDVSINDLKSLKSNIEKEKNKNTAKTMLNLANDCNLWLTLSTGRQSFPIGGTESQDNDLQTMESFYYTQLSKDVTTLLKPSSISMKLDLYYDALKPVISEGGVNINSCHECSTLIKDYEAAKTSQNPITMGIIEAKIVEAGCAHSCLKMCADVSNSLKPISGFNSLMSDTAKTFIFTEPSIS